MTAQVPPSVDFGDINDLLRQANGESTETFVWKSKRQQVKERSSSGAEDHQEPAHCKGKENKEEKGPGAVSKPARQKGKAKRKTQEPITDNDDKGGHAPRPSFLQTPSPDPKENKATDKFCPTDSTTTCLPVMVSAVSRLSYVSWLSCMWNETRKP